MICHLFILCMLLMLGLTVMYHQKRKRRFPNIQFPPDVLTFPLRVVLKHVLSSLLLQQHNCSMTLLSFALVCFHLKARNRKTLALSSQWDYHLSPPAGHKVDNKGLRVALQPFVMLLPDRCLCHLTHPKALGYSSATCIWCIGVVG